MSTNCSNFYNGIFIAPNGAVKPCCRYSEPTNLTWDNDPNPILNSNIYKDLRKKAQQDAYIKGCDKCYAEEKAGFLSLRQRFNKKFQRPKHSLEYLELAFNNICNLTCIGCEPKYSNMWGRKLGYISPEVSNNFHLDDHYDDLSYVSFFGGEPFATNNHLDFMQFLIDKDLAKNITIEYTTNCTLTPTQKWIDSIKLFKKVILICSIDGVGAVNDKIRTGSKWSKIAETFDFYKTLDIELNVNTVVMTENIFHLVELSEWVDANDVNRWYCNVLTWPSELSIRTLPNVDKQQLYPIIANSNIIDKQFILEHLNTL